MHTHLIFILYSDKEHHFVIYDDLYYEVVGFWKATLVSRLHFQVFFAQNKKGGVEPGNVAIVYNSSIVDPGTYQGCWSVMGAEGG